MIEQHTVEVTFQGELVAIHSDEVSSEKLYRTPEGSYFVYMDARHRGEEAVLDTRGGEPGHPEASPRMT